jgi:hypothetical protein
MFDHICVFPDAATAQSALPTYHYEGAWDGSRVIAPLAIITAEAVWEGEGMERTLVTPEQVMPGFWLAVALPALSAELRDLPGDVCRLIADRDAAAAGQPFFAYVSPPGNPETLATARVAPVFAGSSYPFGAV